MVHSVRERGDALNSLTEWTCQIMQIVVDIKFGAANDGVWADVRRFDWQPGFPR